MAVFTSLQTLCLESVAKNLAMWCESATKENFFKYVYVAGPFNHLSSAMIQELLEISFSKDIFKATYFPLVIHENLTKLNLSKCWPVVSDHVLNLIKLRCKNMSHLNLAACSHVSSKCLNNVLPSLTCLKSLDLSSCMGCTDQLLQEFAKADFDFQELNLEMCQRVTDNGMLALIGQECRSLCNLNISFTSVTISILIHILRKVPWLKRLSFSGIHSTCHDGISMDQFPLIQLHYLDILETQLSHSTLFLFKCMPKLLELKLNKIEVDSLDNMLSLSCLTSLDVSGLVLCFGDFVHFLRQRGHQLQSLNMSGIPDVQIAVLCQYCHQLKKLSLAYCERILPTLPPSAMVIDVQHSVAVQQPAYFSDFCQLHSFKLTGSSFDTRTVTHEALVSILACQSDLQELFLMEFQDLNDEVLLDIFDSATSQTLRTLDLSFCKHISMISVYKILDQCCNLRLLDLSNCWNISLAEISGLKEDLRKTRNQLNIIWI